MLVRLTALAVCVGACSSTSGPSADLRTVLFTNPRAAAYLGVAFDTAAPTRLDTAVTVASGAAVCLLFARARLQGDSVVALASADQFGNILDSTFINVARASWTWPGLGPPSVAPNC